MGWCGASPLIGLEHEPQRRLRLIDSALAFVGASLLAIFRSGMEGNRGAGRRFACRQAPTKSRGLRRRISFACRQAPTQKQRAKKTDQLRLQAGSYTKAGAKKADQLRLQAGSYTKAEG